jgi:hypothetical protein
MAPHSNKTEHAEPSIPTPQGECHVLLNDVVVVPLDAAFRRAVRRSVLPE